jgi:hypothetical protein
MEEVDSKKAKTKTPEKRKELIPSQLVAGLVRTKSEAGQLVSLKDIVQVLGEEPTSLPDQEEGSKEALKTIIREALQENQDLAEAQGQEGPRYYSRLYLIDAYAKLLIRKEGDPLLLIAETIREYSKVYPRPIAKEAFKNSPFELTDEEISTCLIKMSKERQFRDIVETKTSLGNEFLYSNLHLEADHASMLAEWIDVGQYQNP